MSIDNYKKKRDLVLPTTEDVAIETSTIIIMPNKYIVKLFVELVYLTAYPPMM